jgi:hypothetical protein
LGSKFNLEVGCLSYKDILSQEKYFPGALDRSTIIKIWCGKFRVAKTSALNRVELKHLGCKFNLEVGCTSYRDILSQEKYFSGALDRSPIIKIRGGNSGLPKR